MPKINQEEYELLKSLSDYWKWIARDKNGRLYKFQEKPKKVNSFQWNDRNQTWLGMSGDRFHFIQWEDEEPYNIAELIKEYGNSYKGSWEHAIEFSKEMRRESEETEVKKGIEWLKKEVNELPLRFLGFSILKQREEFAVSKDDVLELINQLDEPEVLSQEWIKDNLERKGIHFYVNTIKLQNLLVSKQEDMFNGEKPDEGEVYFAIGLGGAVEVNVARSIGEAIEILTEHDTNYSVSRKPVIPKFVADWYEEHKDNLVNQLRGIAFNLDKYGEMPEVNDLDKWINETESPLQTLASLKFGYEVEEEQKYILSINITDKASKTNYETFLNKRGIFHSMENESFNSEEFNWTEEEIKDLESGEILFEHFAVKVEELEE